MRFHGLMFILDLSYSLRMSSYLKFHKLFILFKYSALTSPLLESSGVYTQKIKLLQILVKLLCGGHTSTKSVQVIPAVVYLNHMKLTVGL